AMFWFAAGLLVICISLYLLNVVESQARLDRLTHNWPGPPSLPIIGHLHIMAKVLGQPFHRASEIIISHLTDHRGKIWIGTKLYLVDCNPKDIQALCDAHQLLHKTDDYHVLGDWLGDGILVSNGEKWAHRRKITVPTFNYTMIKEFAFVFEKQSRILIDRLEEYAETGRQVDFLQFISCFTLDSFCETALGVSVGTQLDGYSDYVKAVRDMLDIVDMRLKNPLFHINFIYRQSRHFKRQEELLKTLHGFRESIIQKRFHEIQQDENNKNLNSTKSAVVEEEKPNLCFLDTLLKAKGPDGKPLTVKDIREEVDTIIFGGFELVASTLNFFMYNMTLHPEHQARCREEVWSVCGRDTTKPISIEQLKELEFLEACVKESLRLYPTAPIVYRKASSNVQINDFFIPKDSNVIISLFYMGRCKEFFPNPTLFNPDRWASGAEPKIDASTFIPFMKGGRSCVGQRYAMVLIKMALAHLLRSYQFVPLGERQVKMKLNFVITLHTMEPFLCRVKKI
ncbi:hypothetical protein KR032_005102, partial [Drosophila birchii]